MSKLSKVLLWVALLPLAMLLSDTCLGADRIIRAENMTVARGATNRLYISFESLGGEKALGFTLCFDTNYLTFLSAVRGSTVTNLVTDDVINGINPPTFSVNTNRAYTNGLVGIVFSFHPFEDQTWDAGSNSFAEIRFRGATNGTSSAVTTVAFCTNSPVAKTVSAADGSSLPATYTEATVILQGACSYSLNTNANSFAAGGGSSSISVTADPGCAWTASNTNTWITITSSTNGTGNGTVNYTVGANTNFTSRSGVMVIAGQTFTVSQAAFSCAYTLSPTARNHGYGATNNTVEVQTGNGCSWTISNLNSWITFPAGTNGSGNITNTYLVEVNSNLVSRTGIVMIAGQILKITQDPFDCNYQLSPTKRTHGAGANSNSFSVTTTAPACDWIATTTNSWLTLVTGTNGPGSNTVGYLIAANPNSFPRYGAIFVGDQTFTITNSAAPCDADLTPTSHNHGFGSETGLVSVAIPGGCPWTVENTNSWIIINSGVSGGNGNGTIGYTVLSNSAFVARFGVLTIGVSNTFSITQAAAQCPASISPPSAAYSPAAATGAVNVTIAAGCIWSVNNTNTWITIPSDGVGPSNLTYTITTNSGTAPRIGTLTVAGQSFILTQANASCTIKLSVTSRSHGNGAANNSFNVTNAAVDCNWVVINTNSWITLTGVTNGPGNATVNYSVAANLTPVNRTGSLVVNDQALVLTQTAGTCTLDISPSTRNHGFSAATNTVTVTNKTATLGCPWTISNSNSWIIFPDGTNGIGTTTNTYYVLANTDSVSRTGVVIIANKTLTISQDGAAAGCAITLSPTKRSHGSSGTLADDLEVRAPVGCGWTASTTNSWLAFIGATSGSGTNTVTYSVEPNPNPLERVGSLFIGGQTFVITQAALVCSYTISPTNRAHGYSLATNTISVTPNSIGCAWNATTTNDWITLSGVTNGPGSNTFTYVLAPNADSIGRTGLVFIANRFVSISQSNAPGCSYVLSPTKRSHGSGGTLADDLEVRAPEGCAWTASTTNSWIEFIGATSGSGTNTVTYSVDPNPNPLERVGSLLIGGQTFVITQAALVCSFTISPTNRTHGFGAATNTISVAPNGIGCDWNATTTNNWITLSGVTNGPGSNTFTYVLAPNADSIGRTGLVFIANRFVSISQSNALGLGCSYVLSPTKRTHGSGGTLADDLEVRAPEGCAWTASTTNSWLAFIGTTNGLGTNTVTYSVDPNPDPMERVGGLLIGGQTFVITQQALVCSYTISPTNRAHGYSLATNTISVTPNSTGCAWNATTTNDWITLSGVTNGPGSNTFTYVLAPNADSFGRTGLVFIANRFVSVSQSNAPGCNYVLSPTKRSHGSGGTLADDLEVRAPEGCAWTASTTNSWIEFIGATSGSGTNTVTYSVDPNPNPLERVGSLLIGGQTFVITQAALACSFTLSPTNLSRAHGHGAVTNTIEVRVNGFGCDWNATTTNAWITLSNASGSGSNFVTYILAPNPIITSRTGFVMIAGQNFTVSQSGAPCTYDLSPASTTHGYGRTTNDVTLETLAGCPWTLTNANAWITISQTNEVDGTNIVFTYIVEANPFTQWRTGEIAIASEVFTIIQQPLPCEFAFNPPSAAHGTAAGSGSFSVTTSGDCSWTPTTAESWITITSGSGVGLGQVTYTFPENLNGSRVGQILVGGAAFQVTQQGPCTFLLASNSASYGPGPQSRSVAVTASGADCAWSVSKNVSWITIQSAANNTNSGVVSYSVDTNGTAITRIGVLTIAGQSFTVMQTGTSCSYQLSSTSASYGAAATNGSVSVTTPLGCTWAASSGAAWISVTANTNTGIASYTVQTNTTANTRIGILTVAGQSFTVTQTGTSCSYQLSSTSASYGAAATNGTVSVTTPLGCTWAVSSGAVWLSVTANTNTGIASYTVQTNDTAITRIGVLTIAGQSFTITQAGTSCSYQLSSTSASYGAAATNGSVSVTTPLGCTWAVSSGAAWLSVTANTNTGIASYTVQTNDTAITRIGVLTIAGQSFTVTQTGTSCSYQLSSTSASYGAAATNGTVSVTTPLGCTWAVSSGAVWLSVTANTNTGIASYTVQTNDTAITRIGVLTIAGQSFTVTQTGTSCSYQLSSTSASYGAAATNGSVSVTTPLGCTWAASSGAAWISVTANTNTGIASYTVQTNTTANTRIGILTVAGQSFTVTQTGTSCSYQLSSTSASYGAAATNGTVSVTTPLGCTWAVSSGAVWLSVTANTNTGIASYTVQTNDTAITRIGVLTIAGQSFTITQTGTACSFLMASNNATHGSGSETGFVAVTTLTGCTWTVSTTNPWISILSSTNNTNSGIVNYSVVTNPAAITRVGSVKIDTQVFTITQTGAGCSYSNSATSATHGAGLEIGSVSVTTVAGCTWTVQNPTPWVSILSSTNNTNSGSVIYSVATNSSSFGRTGTVTIAGQLFTVAQFGANCTYSLASNNVAFGPAAGSGAVTLTTLTGCVWTVSNSIPWITIQSATSNTNSGLVSYSVLSNGTALSRTGVVGIAGLNFTVTQSGANCSFLVASNSAVHGPGLENGQVSVTTLTGCVWTVSNSIPWITLQSSMTNNGSGIVSYGVLSNGTALSRTGVVTVAGQSFSVRQSGAVCTFLLSSNIATHSVNAATGSVSLTTLTGCTWTVSTTNPWITILSAASNLNSGVVTYSVLSNATVIPRSGTIFIDGQTFTVNQAGNSCLLTLQWSNWVHRSLSETGIIGVISLSGCPWVVTTTNSWITITTGTNGSGSGHAGYAVAENTDSNSRTGAVIVAGIPFVVAQMGTDCTYVPSWTTRIHGTGANSNTIGVVASSGCSWSVLNTNSWITILSNAVGTGSQTVGYGIAKNTGTALRAGVINIAGEILSITQWGTDCGFVLQPNSETHGFGPETNLVTLKASSSSCSRSASNTNSWIVIISVTGSSGDGTVSYRVIANTNGTPRTGVFTVGGTPFTVTQDGVPCSFTLSSSSAAYDANPANGSVAVTTGAGCVWNVINNNSWITITNGLSRTNNGSANYIVDANTTASARTGIVSIAGQSFTISQAGAACGVLLTPASATHGNGAETGSVAVTMSLPGCTWNATTTNPWITILSGAIGTNSGNVSYSILANDAAIQRTGVVNIAGQNFTVTQAAAACAFTILTSNATHGAGMETGSVAVTTFVGCTWSAVSNDSWITILSGANSTNGGNVTYRVGSNSTVVARSGSITVAGQTFNITQLGQPCSYVLSPTSASHSFGVGNGSVSVTASNGCNWTAANSNSWITITSPTNGSGNGTVSYTVATNGGLSRTGYLLIGNVPFPVTQSGSVRIIRAENMIAVRGQTNRLYISFESLGGEKALGFTLCFDTNYLTFLSAVRGSTVTNLVNDDVINGINPPTFSVNTNGAYTNGLVGIVFSFHPFEDQTWAAGSNAFAEIRFRGTTNGTNPAVTTVAFCTNSPVAKSVSAADGSSLLTTFTEATVFVQGDCTYALNTNAATFTSAGGSGSFNVAAQSLCQWTVQNPNSWITINSATSSNGNGTVNFTVAANTGATARTGAVTIATQTFIVNQDRTPCTYTISPNNRTHTASPETGSVHVTATNSCGWTVSNTNSWITITSSTNGMDTGDVTYSVSSNSSAVARSGNIVIAGQLFTVNQAGAACAFTILPTSKTHGFTSETGSVSVTSSNGCNWTVDNTNSWILITSGTNGSGSNNVTYTLEYNPNNASRIGVVTIATKQYTISQSANTCPVTLSPTNRIHGAGVETNSFNVTNVSACAWTVSNTNSWVSILSATNGTGNATITYAVTNNSLATARSGIVRVSGREYTITQTNATCSFTLSPSSRAHGSGTETGPVTLIAVAACPWTAISSNNWITITPTNGIGGSNLSYTVSANPASFSRTGVVNIAGQIFTVTQGGAQCTYLLSATGAVWTADGNTGEVNLTTPIGCSWTVTNINPWISAFADISGKTNGTGSTTLYYVLDANPSGAARTGLVSVAGQIFTIRQLGQPCDYTLSTTNAVHGPGVETNVVGVTTVPGCAWGANNTNSWITILSGTIYTGSASVQYRVSTNTAGIERSGTIVIAGQNVMVTQAGTPCSYALSANSAVYTYTTVTGLVNVIATNNCSWTIVNTNTSWIAVKSPSALAGTNNATIKYTVAANTSPNPRSGNLVIAGLVHTVTQFGGPCSYTLSSNGRFHGSGSETGQVTVVAVAECTWLIDNTNDWITVSPTNGAGTAVINYTVHANPSATDRTGAFVIGDQVYTVLQFGAACNYALSVTNVFHGGLSETGSVDVASPLGCNWAVTEALSWVTILSAPTGTNIGTVKYSVAANITGTNRGGVISIGNGVTTASLAVTQAPVVCSFSVAPTNIVHGFEAELGNISVTTSNICPWTVIKTNTWITFSSATNNVGSTNLAYSVTANPSATARTGVVMVAGQPVTIRQIGLVCSYALAPTSLAHGFMAATGQVAVAAPTLCSWTVSNTNGWITLLTGTSYAGSNTVRYAITNNSTATPRTGFITIAGQTFTVTQTGLPFIAASNKTVLCSAAWDFDAPVLAPDNCVSGGYYTMGVTTVTNLGCGATFIATRIWTATNACFSYMMVTQTVSVVTQPPVINCAPDKTAECGTVWTFNAPTATEFCGGSNASISVVSTVTNAVGMCGNTFIITRTWRATDACGNQSSCSQSVRIVDTTPPTVVCAPSKTVECGSPWNFDVPTGTDSCAGTNVLIRVFSTVTNVSGACGFTATRVWEIFDACTNRSTCSQTVTVVDTTPPVLTCAAAKTLECGTVWNFDPPTATDNCSGTNVTIVVWSTVTNAIGSCGNTFTATRTWEAIDGCGNMDFCSQTVRLIDTTPPVPTCSPNKTIEFGQSWDFDAPTGTDSCGGTNVTVRIVSTVTNTSGFCGPTFSTTRTWEIADGCSNKVNCTQTVTVRDTTAPAITCAVAKTVNCLQAWTFDAPTAIDIGSGTNLTITVLGTVTNGTCGSGFTATRTWRTTDACGNSVTCSQVVSGRAVVSIGGTVFNATNYPATMSDKRVAGTTVLGPTNSSSISGPDGSFSSVFEAASNVVITPVAPTGGTPSDGVTTLDISLVRRHILSVSNLDLPYKLLAADVDGSGSISTLDLSFMRRLILGVTNRFPAGMWRFVPSNYAFTNMSNPWAAPTNRTYGGVASDLTGQDFVAIKLGDVNNSWSPAVGDATAKSSTAKDATPVVSFQVNGGSALPGSSVLVQVTVSGFRQVTSIQGALSWDPAVIRFAGTEGFGLDGLGAGNFGTNRITDGKLAFSWDDPIAQGVTQPDGTAIFSARFDVIGTAGSTSPVMLMDSILVREVGVNFAAATFQAIDGQVRVIDRPRVSPGAFTQGSFGLSVPTVSGKHYTLEYTDAIPTTNWIALPPVIGDGNINLLVDPAPAAQKRFYRVKVE